MWYMWYGHPSQHGTQACGHPGHKGSPKNWASPWPHKDHDPSPPKAIICSVAGHMQR